MLHYYSHDISNDCEQISSFICYNLIKTINVYLQIIILCIIY